MAAGSYQIRQCQREGCGLRYPVLEGQPFDQRCPRCRGTTRLVLERPLELEPWQQVPPSPLRSSPSPSAALALHALLDNIRSAWNVGSMFRSAQGAGLAYLHLCGITPTPDNSTVGKTALGAEQTVPWDYAMNGVVKVRELLAQGYHLWALEQDERACPIDEVQLPASTASPLVLVVGNERCGVDPGILECCEQVVDIPMHGGKRSLNVAVAFGIAAFTLRRKQPPPGSEPAGGF